LTAQFLDNEKAILEQVAAGDEQAFTRLFTHYSGWIYATSYKLTDSSHTAEEIVQDVFLKIWLKRAELDKIESFVDYLYVMARNQSVSVLRTVIRNRKILHQLATTTDQSVNETENDIIYNDYRSILQEGVNRLPPRQGEIYRLIREKGMKREEVAGLLGISPHTVKAHLREAIRTVRAYYLARLGAPIAAICLFLQQ
jgi:RNA polymerase sigma-70 factor (family 1)